MRLNRDGFEPGVDTPPELLLARIAHLEAVNKQLFERLTEARRREREAIKRTVQTAQQEGDDR